MHASLIMLVVRTRADRLRIRPDKPPGPCAPPGAYDQCRVRPVIQPASAYGAVARRPREAWVDRGPHPAATCRSQPPAVGPPCRESTSVPPPVPDTAEELKGAASRSDRKVAALPQQVADQMNITIRHTLIAESRSTRSPQDRSPRDTSVISSSRSIAGRGCKARAPGGIDGRHRRLARRDQPAHGICYGLTWATSLCPRRSPHSP
jgi:hypothetical protein